jgi:hypothetical protein
MQTCKSYPSVFLGLAVSAAVLVVAGIGPGAATTSAQEKDQAYEAKFECAIPLTGTTCVVALDKKIPAGKRLKIEYVKARLLMPNAIKSAFDFYVDFGDPGGTNGVGSIHIVPASGGRTEGGFFGIWIVDEKVDAFAYRTADFPAPKVHLTNTNGDPMHLQNGNIQDGVLGGHLVAVK